MIAALILWIVRRYCTKRDEQNTATNTRYILRPVTKKKIITTLFILLAIAVPAQEQRMNYSIIYRDGVVGNMQFYQRKTDQNIYVKVTSNVRIRFIVNVKVDTEEESQFEDGKLVYSSVYRNVNGKQKARKQTKVQGDVYQISSEGKTVTLDNAAINYNLTLLYCSEPVGVHRVYSDNFQQFLNIKKVADHKYKIELPDGNYNYYSFDNGICNLVEVHHSFYTIYIKLNDLKRGKTDSRLNSDRNVQGSDTTKAY
jgi:hypothetical protein